MKYLSLLLLCMFTAFTPSSDISIMNDKEEELQRQEEVLKDSLPEGKLKISKGVSTLGITILTIVITALVTWYINFKLSHLAPVLSISNVEFTYDLKGVSDIVEVPEILISLDNEGFFGSGIKNFMRMEDLQIFSKKDRPDIISKRYELFEKELIIFTNLLRKDEINYEILAHYMMDFLRSNGFNGVASFLVFLEEEKRIKPLFADESHLQSLLESENGALKLSNNLYLLPNTWEKAAKTENQKYMAGKIEQFAERMAWNVIQQNDKKLLMFLDEGLNALNKSWESDLEVEHGIIQLIEQQASMYKKIKLELLIVNRSDFPLLLLPDCELIFNSSKKNNKMTASGIIISDLNDEVSPNNLFNAIVLNGKDNQKLIIKSYEISTNDLKSIEELYLENYLQVKVRIKAKTQKSGQKEFESNWLTINTSIGLDL